MNTTIADTLPTIPGWRKRTHGLPPEGVEVMTMVCDNDGERNHQILVRKGSLWFFPDMSMYVYYTPTHWKYGASAL